MPLVRLLHPGQRLGPYVLLQSLGEGALTATWLARAHDDPRGMRLVLKTIALASLDDPDVEDIFLEEAERVQRFAHPSVARLLAAGRESSFLFAAYPWVDGHALASLLALSASEPLPRDVALRLMLAMCDAVAAVHAAGLVHRAINPATLRLTLDGSICLLDLGITTLLTQTSATTSRHMVGKFSHLSPEQLWSRPVRAHSDVFSLGLIFYELLVGRHPFLGQHERETVANILSPRPAPSPTRFDVHLPPSLEGFLLRALAKSPDERFASAEELRHALLEALADRNALASGEEVQALLARRLGHHVAPVEEAVPSLSPATPSSPLDEVVTGPARRQLAPALIAAALLAALLGWLAWRSAAGLTAH